jgi:hypothetical protein
MKIAFQVVAPSFPIPRDGIVGKQFLKENDLNINLKRQVIFDRENIDSIIHDTESKKEPEIIQPFVLPPRCEKICEVEIDRPDGDYVINSSRFDNSVLMASAIIKVNNNKSYVAFLNPNESEIKVDEVSVHVESLNQFNCFHFNESGNSSNNHTLNVLEREQKIVENLRLEHLNSEEQKQITDICFEYSDLFTFKSKPLSETKSISHTIPMTPAQTPIKLKPYRLPHAQQSKINRQVRTMLEKGVIKPSTSPWNSPLLIIPKK